MSKTGIAEPFVVSNSLEQSEIGYATFSWNFEESWILQSIYPLLMNHFKSFFGEVSNVRIILTDPETGLIY